MNTPPSSCRQLAITVIKSLLSIILIAAAHGEMLRIHGVFRIPVDPASPHLGGASHVWGDWFAEYDDANVSQTQTTTLTVPLVHFAITPMTIGSTNLDHTHMEAVLNFSSAGVFASASIRRIGGAIGQDGVELNYLNYANYYSQFTPDPGGSTPPMPPPPPPPLYQSVRIASDSSVLVSFTSPGTAIVDYTILSGTQTPQPNISVTGSTSMGSVLLGSAGSPQTLTVCNYGFAPLNGLSANLVGGAATEYMLDTSLLGSSLAPGQCTTVSLTFSPLVTGPRNVTLELGSNDPDENPFLLALNGTGVSPYAISQDAYVKASDTTPDAGFGTSVAISGNYAVVGAPNAGTAGQAYVYNRDTAGQWHHQATLAPQNGDAGDSFGISVAISGDTIVVGAQFEDSNSTVIGSGEADNTALNAGAAYVFVRSGTTWSPQGYLKASDADANDQFGGSVSISGDTIVVGASEEGAAPNGGSSSGETFFFPGSGAAYVFVRSSQTWTEQARLVNPGFRGFNQFGASVSVSGDLIAIGRPGNDNHLGGDLVPGSTGAVDVFERNSMLNWNSVAVLVASNRETGDRFGDSVAISNTSSGLAIAVGAYGEDGGEAGTTADPNSNTLSGSGAAYVFTTDAFSNWVQFYLKASNPDIGDSFGRSVSISGDSVVVGAYLEDGMAVGVDGCDPADNSMTQAGAAYLFELQRDSLGNPLTPAANGYLKASNTNEGDRFGASVAIDGDTVIIGANGEDSVARNVGGMQLNNSMSNAGAAYIFNNPSPSTNALALYDAAAATAGLSGSNALPETIPFNDGVENLLKYAFNMDFSGAASHTLVPGGSSGLPWGGIVQINGQDYWRFEYLIRKGSSLDYRPVKSPNLQSGCFQPMAGTKAVTTIDSTWSRVTIDEPYDPNVTPACFYRVEVEIP